MRRVLLVMLALLPGAALCQSPEDSTAAPPPGASAQLFPYGNSRTYRAIVNETLVLILRERQAEPDSLRDPELGLGNLVVDETLTRTGGYFYDVFFRLWRPPPGTGFASVTVQETPLPGQGTLIAVQLSGELVFQARLPIREEEAEPIARQAVSVTLRRLPRG